jgi:hypothetical protein
MEPLMPNSAYIQTTPQSKGVVDCQQAINIKSGVHIRSTQVRPALAARLWRAAELQAAEIEARLAMGARSVAESEKDARVLSILAKTLRDLSAVDDANCEADDNDEDTASDDLETLREELGVRLRRINQERTRTTQVGTSRNN